MMKTSVNMIRKMGNFEVTQRTKDSFFNATELLRNWNSVKSNPQRDLSKFWDQDNVKDFIDVMMREENLDTPQEVYVKSKASRGNNVGTWMSPTLFVKFAMWLNPKFEYFVVKFVSDQLMLFRNDAGTKYIELSNAVQRLNGCDYIKMAKGLNWIIFNRHKSGILRQQATQEQLKELNDLQKKLAFAIEMGYIRTFDELIHEMRKIWASKWATLTSLN